MCAGAGCSHGLTSSDLVGRRRSLCAAGEGNGRVVCPPGTPWPGSVRVCPPSFDAGQLWWFDRGRVCGRAPVKLLGLCATCGVGSCRSGLVLRLVAARIRIVVVLLACSRPQSRYFLFVGRACKECQGVDPDPLTHSAMPRASARPPRSLVNERTHPAVLPKVFDVGDQFLARLKPFAVIMAICEPLVVSSLINHSSRNGHKQICAK